VIFAAVLNTPQAEEAARTTQPHQLALGTSRGVEKLVHICRAAYHSGYIIGKNDYQNGFNSLSRQALLDAHCKAYPAATSIFNKLYGLKSPCYSFDECDQLIAILSEEGSRQGCAAGTEGFCVTIAPVVHKLQAKYPRAEFRIITDDIFPLLPPPSEDSLTAWQNLYIEYACLLADLKRLSKEDLGLTLNLDKCGLLLPINAPEPAPEVKALFAPGFKFHRDGLRIGGAPVGTETYTDAFVATKVQEATDKLKILVPLSTKMAHAGQRLLSSCATSLLNHIASTVPPEFVLHHLHEYDRAVTSTLLSIIEFAEPNCSKERLKRAELRMSLPAPKGMCIYKTVDFASIAWWSSVAAMSDPLFYKLRHGMDAFVENAFANIQSMADGTQSEYWAKVSSKFPAQASGLLDGVLYNPSPHKDKQSDVKDH
jgi:hypothetical protein